MTGSARSRLLSVGLLGPFVVSVDGRPVSVTGRLRTLLTLLVLSAGTPVSTDRLAAGLWGEDLPNDVRRSLQTYVTRLRAALGAGLIGTREAGYVLFVQPERVDAIRFVELLDAAAKAPDPDQERALLVEALALWRGTPFEDVRSAWLEDTELPRLVERYLAAVERRVDLDAADGLTDADLVAELTELTARYPLRESMWARLLLLLDRCGRRAEALARYETIRVRLADELGVDPGPQLRRVHADLLADQPVGMAVGPGPAGAWSVVPRQLPADIDGFAGRDSALKALDNMLGAGDVTGPRPVLIAAIAGPAGIGKSTLAVHWAHWVAERFRDGQLYVNLRGFAPSGRATTPAEAVRGFLDALGVPARQIPPGLDAQVGLYRSVLAGRRVLVVLDNARDAEQVRPLLPGSSGCLAVVTSRDQLAGLVVAEAAHLITLDLLSTVEAHDLLGRRLGRDRVAAATTATHDIIDLCARLPLALAIVAARAATHPGFPLGALAGELRDARSDLDAFAGTDPSTDVRTVFSWSYHTLDADTARLFRLLGLHPGPDIATPAAASLAGLERDRTRTLLARLCRANLLTEHAPGRYTFHDLLRAYAAELAHRHDPDTARHAARHRTLDHYVHSGHTATMLLSPTRDPVDLAPAGPGVTPEVSAERRQAMAWFDAEHAVLLAVVGEAYTAGFDSHAWQLAWALTTFLDHRGHWDDWVATQRVALSAARRLDDQPEQARAQRNLAAAYARQGRYDDARTHYGYALDLAFESGDRTGQAHAHRNLAYVFEREGRYEESLGHVHNALDLFRAAGHPVGQARALNSIGWLHALRGNHRQALAFCQQALALHLECGDRVGQAETWDSLGYAHHHLGNHDDAVGCYLRAVEIFHDVGSRYTQTEVLVHLGDAHHAAGDRDAAHAAWRQALDILVGLDHPDADRLRARLRGIAPAH